MPQLALLVPRRVSQNFPSLGDVENGVFEGKPPANCNEYTDTPFIKGQNPIFHRKGSSQNQYKSSFAIILHLSIQNMP